MCMELSLSNEPLVDVDGNVEGLWVVLVQFVELEDLDKRVVLFEIWDIEVLAMEEELCDIARVDGTDVDDDDVDEVLNVDEK